MKLSSVLFLLCLTANLMLDCNAKYCVAKATTSYNPVVVYKCDVDKFLETKTFTAATRNGGSILFLLSETSKNHFVGHKTVPYLDKVSSRLFYNNYDRRCV